MENDQYQYWYVMYTYPGFEKKIQKSLLQKKMTCFLPLYNLVRQWSDRKKVIEVPLFPNYIFVLANQKNRFEILNIYGISRFVTYNGKPVVVSEKEIDTIQKTMVTPGVMLEDYLEGDLVLIINGPLIGLEGVVFEKKGKKRIGVKIESINQYLSIEVCSTDVKKVYQSLTVAK
jgi:transcriptional antiterminator RfaH